MRRTEAQSTAARGSSLKTIEGLLDYAILESAELGLPLIVCLLRMARLELETAFVSSSSNRDLLNKYYCCSISEENLQRVLHLQQKRLGKG